MVGEREIMVEVLEIIVAKQFRLKVCACVYACGLNGFKYAMLWNQ